MCNVSAIVDHFYVNHLVSQELKNFVETCLAITCTCTNSISLHLMALGLNFFHGYLSIYVSSIHAIFKKLLQVTISEQSSGR